MILSLGIDPGVRSTGLALIRSHAREPEVLAVACLKVPDKIKGVDAVVTMIRQIREFVQTGALYERDANGNFIPPNLVVVEAQQVYRIAGRNVDPDDLLRVAHVAGGAVSAFATKKTGILMPLPREWKGQIPKEIHHKRILSKFPNYEKARGWGDLNKGDLEHVIDAIGLAAWGLGQTVLAPDV